MRLIKLTRGFETIVDDEWFDNLSKYKWFAQSGVVRPYAARMSSRVPGPRGVILMHRVIMGEPAGRLVDHKDGNVLNNMMNNLRLATHSQNLANIKQSRPMTSSKYKGVCFCVNTGRFVAICGGQWGGRHDTEEDAAVAYNELAIRIYGEFAALNVVEI